MNLRGLASESLTNDDRPAWLKGEVRRPLGFRYYNFLSLLAKRMDAKLIVELGTNRGTSALHFRHGNEKARIVSIDIRHNPLDAGKLKKSGIECVTGKSVEMAERVEGPIDILFIDADHTEKAVLGDVQAYLFKVRSGGIVLFDDVHLDEGMESAWKKLQVKYDYKFEDLSELHPSAGFGAMVVP